MGEAKVVPEMEVMPAVVTKGEPMGKAMAVKRSWDLMPGSLGDAMEIGKMIADSDFAPKDYRGKPANVVIAIQMGADIGLKPLQALQGIAVVNGKPSLYGDAALALALSSGQIESLKETDDGTAAKCIIKRKGLEPVERTFSMDDAKTAGLLGKAGPWTNYPKRMRQMRARGFALRDAVPDLLMGLGLVEEAQDYVQAEAVAEERNVLAGVSDEDRERMTKAFETLHLSDAQRRVALMKHLTRTDRTPAESVEALLVGLRDEYAKRKTGKPAPQKALPESQADPAQPEPAPPVDTTAADIADAKVQDAEVAAQEPEPEKPKRGRPAQKAEPKGAFTF